jgi:hypothetical protein
MRKLLFQFDSSRLPSAFDRVVAYDGGADEVLSYGGVAEADVRDLVHGAIFTRGLKDLRKTAIFIGGADMAAGERLLAEARKAFFGPFSVSVMLDSNGSNTTAVAAVAKALQTVGDVSGRRAVVTAGTGPVGQRAAGLLARAGAEVVITSRRHDEGEHIAQAVSARFRGRVSSVEVRDASALSPVLDGAHVLINAGPAGVKIVPRDAWAKRRPPTRRGGDRGERQRHRARGGDRLRRPRRGRVQDEGAQGVHRPSVRAERPGARCRVHR